ncbi:MAG TPA: MarR family transcriptional regulator [Longimicrobiales bacterium]
MGSARGTGQARLEQLALRLHRAAIHLLRRVRREDRGLGLNPARASALSVLVFGGPRTMGELAAEEQVTPATMSRIVAGLARAGLVRRSVDPSDGRVVRVQATAAGARVLEAGRQRRIEALTRLLAGLDAEALEALDRAADALEDMLAAPGHRAPAAEGGGTTPGSKPRRVGAARERRLGDGRLEGALAIGSAEAGGGEGTGRAELGSRRTGRRSHRG